MKEKEEYDKKRLLDDIFSESINSIIKNCKKENYSPNNPSVFANSNLSNLKTSSMSYKN
jgi:hypothetical protein